MHKLFTCQICFLFAMWLILAPCSAVARQDTDIKSTQLSDSEFISSTLSEEQISSLKTSGIWNDKCPIPPHRLRLLTVRYWDFEGTPQIGHIMVLDAAAPYVLEIFRDLYSHKFNISKIQLADQYAFMKSGSTADNNTLCFDCYQVEGKQEFSVHSYGLAIDINPIQNPFIEFPKENETLAVFSPVGSRAYANRSIKRPGMVEEVIDVFKNKGFTVWGGHWQDEIDYMHFQTARGLAYLLATMEPEMAKTFFDIHVLYAQNNKELGQLMYEDLISITNDKKNLVDFYKENPREFKASFEKFKTSILNKE